MTAATGPDEVGGTTSTPASAASPTVRVFVACHETSADVSAAAVIVALRGWVEGAGARLEVAGFGGPALEAAGTDLWRETTTHATGGIVEVLGEIPRVLREIRHTVRRVRTWRPHLALLMDAPDYNVRLAYGLRRACPGMPIDYFLVPQIWAWRSGRVKQLARAFDRRFCIVPFEPAWFARFHVHAEFVGHPGVTRVQDRLATHASAAGVHVTYAQLDDRPHVGQHEVDGNSGKPAEAGAPPPAAMAPVRAQLLRDWALPVDAPFVALLPGSRRKEVKSLLAIQLETVQRVNQARVARGEDPLRPLIAVAPRRDPEEYRPTIAPFVEGGDALQPVLFHPDAQAHAVGEDEGGEGESWRVVRRGTSLDVCFAADAALVASGTASLETALAGCPQVVCYKVNALTAWIIRRLIRVEHASLVNLVMGREVVVEKLQQACTPTQLQPALARLLSNDTATRTKLRAEYGRLRSLFGPPGAAERVAARIAHDQLGINTPADARQLLAPPLCPAAPAEDR